MIAASEQLLAVHPGLPAKSVQELIALAKAKPGEITAAASGIGSSTHLNMELFKTMAGVDILIVPYKGGGPLSQDMVAGHVDIGIATPALLSPHVRAGKLRPLVVTGEKRTPALPDVPSLAEQGFPGFSALAFWGVLAPTGVPRPIFERFHAEVARILAIPEVNRQLSEQLGMEMVISSPAVFRTFLEAEIARWGKVVRENDIKAD